jgi:hypothetical protein
MAAYRKRLVTEIRDTLGWFPNWPLHQHLSLGLVGYYHGWRKTFEWRTSLTSLGINHTLAGGQGLLDDIYATENAVQARFHTTGDDTNPMACFSFNRRHSLVAQCHQSTHVSLDIFSLQREILSAINSGTLTWDKEWVILTEIFNAKGFSALIAGSRKSSASLSASTRVSASAFNIADPQLGIRLMSSEFMAYQAVARQDVTPYFYIHKFTYGVRSRVPRELRRYRGMAPRFNAA